MSLTDAEHDAMELTSALVGKVCQDVIGTGPTRDQDIAEFVHHIHAIQHMIMAQSAAREHPHLYRLLGETL